MALADNVKLFTGETPNDFDAKVILEACARRNVTSVVIIGWEDDGDFLFTSSMGDGPECLWLLEMAKKKLLETGDPDSGE
jgi:hypothetical protein